MLFHIPPHHSLSSYLPHFPIPSQPPLYPLIPQHFPTFSPYPSTPFLPISLSTYPPFHIHQIPTIFTLSYLQHYHLFFLSLKSDFGYPMMVYSHHFPLRPWYDLQGFVQIWFLGKKQRMCNH